MGLSKTIQKDGAARRLDDPLSARLESIVAESFKPMLEIFRLLSEVDENSKTEEVLNTILDKARQLFEADRVEIALWDPEDKKLRIHAQSGSISKKMGRIGDSIVAHGVMMRVWKARGARSHTIFENRLKHGINYFRVDRRTKTEVAARIHHKGRKIGVLNLEWFRHAEWSREKSAILDLLAEQAALALNIVDGGAIIRDLAGSLASKEDVPRAVCRVLERVSNHHRFDRALVYQADNKNRQLVVNYVLTRGGARGARGLWSYRFDETSFVAHVFSKGKPAFEPNPWNPKQPVSSKGLKKFHIKGPMLGLPLRHENVLLGVLVIWTRSGFKLTSKDSYALAPIADLLAAMLAPKSTVKPALVSFELLSDLLRESQNAIEPNSAIKTLLHAVQAFGFERARFLKYDKAKNEFIRVLQVSFGREPDLKELRITASSKYASDIVANFRRNPEARIYHPRETGTDPDHRRLGKKRGTPWIAAPIAFHGGLIGQLAADNEHSLKPFPPFSQQFLTLAAGIAAFVLDRVSLNNLSPLDELPIAMFSKDKRGRFLWMNRRFAKDCNRTIEEARGLTDLRLFGPRLAAIYRERDQKVMKSQKTLSWIEQNVTKNKSRWVHVVKAPLLNASGDVIGIQGMYVEEAYRAIFQHASEGIYQSTPQGRYLDVNPALASLLGFKSREDLLGANLDISTVYENRYDSAAFRAKIHLNQGSLSNFESVLKRQDGSLVKISEDAWEVKNSDGELLYYEGIIRDISKQIRLSAAVATAEEEGLSSGIGRTIAHEVGNRVSIAAQCADILKGQPLHSEKTVDELATAVFDNLSEARNLLEAYKSGERSGLGPPALVYETVKESVFLMSLLLSKAGFEEPTLNLRRCTVTLPTIRLAQILVNLIKNSIEAAERNNVKGIKTISISSRVMMHSGRPTQAILEYRDRSGGMSQETANSLFRREDRGRGMLVVSKLLDRYDGRIELNTTFGKGSKFIITMPIEGAKR